MFTVIIQVHLYYQIGLIAQFTINIVHKRRTESQNDNLTEIYQPGWLKTYASGPSGTKPQDYGFESNICIWVEYLHS